jgi:ubiquinone/menaquinone biosynthesis C-methylase UbiE
MNDSQAHERHFHGDPDRLRSPERVAMLEVERVVALSLEDLVVKSVLDVGTGTGVFAEAFSKLVPDVTGIDTNIDMLALARSYVPGAQFTEGKAEAIPFEDGAFDVAFLGHVLHETDDALKAVREARRVARSRVVILEWPYKKEQEGPPFALRLRPEAIEDFAGQAGYRKVENLKMNHMVLYRLTP